MRIYITAKPNAKEPFFKKIDGTHFVVAVKEPPVQGKANAAIIQSCAEYFNVPRTAITIVQGYTSREKVIEVLQDEL